MPIDDFTPDLSKLGSDYQVLTELHSDRDARTYLARHLGLNRDVTITVVRAARDEGQGSGNDLSHFASDARLLATMRHPSVIPVIEGRWLGNDAFAIVRARVRGSTLDELVSAMGPLPLPRTAGTLEDVNATLEWARANGVVHRHVSPHSLVFPQGSGRVLVALEPTLLSSGGLPSACDDARTIGELAATMLSGRSSEDPLKGLTETRADLPPRIVTATNALLTCDPAGAPPDVRGYLALLTPPPAAAPVSTADGLAAPGALPDRAGNADEAIVVVNRPFGFNARLATAIAVAAVIVVMAVLLLHRRSGESASRVSATQIDTGAQSGDVALRARQADTALLAAAPPPPVVTSAPVSPPATSQIDTGVPPTTPAIVSPPASAIAPPLMRRHDPTRASPPAGTLPAASPSVADSTRPSRDSGSTNPGDACSSPAAADQRSCLTNAVERADRDLNATYQRLIAALRRQANAQPDDPDPATVGDLRATQRKWLESRDAACHDVGTAPFFAQARGACYADQSAQRTRDLQQMLDTLPPPS